MDPAALKRHYQDEAVARSYDRSRFSSLAGRVLDALEKRAIGRLLDRARSQAAHPVVLDVPCGTGRITEYLLNRGLTLTGGDVSLPMLEQARARCVRFGDRATFRRLDLDRLDMPDGAFDLVTCVRLFHHLGSGDRGRVLAELARVSRRWVLVNVSYSSPYYRLRRRGKRLLGQGVSRASSTREDIAREAAGAGLTLAASAFILPLLSEDLFLLLDKGGPQGQPLGTP